MFGVRPVLLDEEGKELEGEAAGLLAMSYSWPGQMRSLYGNHKRFHETLGTAEVESALVLHKAVAEAAVVGYPHDIKGQGIYAYVTLMSDAEYTDELKAELVKHVRKEIGPIATPDVIHWAPGLPKTRSGKIMRRILRKIAEDDYKELGDTSTLADPSVVDDLISSRVT